MTELVGLDLAAVQEFLGASRPDFLTGPLRGELISGGRSNLTYVLTDGRRRWVLRRPPLGHVQATAHDMSREYRMIAALDPTEVPVPRPVVLAGADVIGVPFYMMEHVEGAVLRSREQLAQLSGTQAQELAGSLIDVLACLHRLDYAAVGLCGLGRPEGYLDRQVARFSRQLGQPGSRDQAGVIALGERLGHRLPQRQRAAVVHGDYRLDNVVMADGSIAAVLDWEMATLGDPLADLAITLMWWDGLCGLDSPVAAVPGEMPGFPSGEFLADRYAAATGYDLADLPWYLGFAYWKTAVIFEGIHHRAAEGLTVGEGFDRIGELVPALIERGTAVLAGV
jgi:aminoglycoside phosphotransferase (APT) family kinase protein